LRALEIIECTDFDAIRELQTLYHRQTDRQTDRERNRDDMGDRRPVPFYAVAMGQIINQIVIMCL